MGVAVVQIGYSTHTCGVSGYPTSVRTITYIFILNVLDLILQALSSALNGIHEAGLLHAAYL